MLGDGLLPATSRTRFVRTQNRHHPRRNQNIFLSSLAQAEFAVTNVMLERAPSSLIGASGFHLHAPFANTQLCYALEKRSKVSPKVTVDGFALLFV